jgi:hypothetical protein
MVQDRISPDFSTSGAWRRMPLAHMGIGVRTVVIDLRLADMVEKHFDRRFCGQNIVLNRIDRPQDAVDSNRLSGTIGPHRIRSL